MTAATGSRTAESQPKPRPEPHPVRVRSERRAMLALARAEARRLLLHPLVLIALVVYLALVLWPGGEPEDAYPVLQDIDRETQVGQLLLGLAVMVAVNLAVLRSHRRGTDASFAVLVLPPWRRTVAHVLSALPTVLVGALIVAGQFTAEALKPGAVGRGSVAELLTGPLLVLLPATLGVLLARVARSAFVAPLAVIAFLAVSMVFVADWRSPAWLRGMTPVLFDEGARPLPSDLLGRPAAAHALYLLALAVLVAAGAVLLSGGRTRAVRATALGALGVVVAAVVLQSTAPSRRWTDRRVPPSRRPPRPECRYVCRDRRVAGDGGLRWARWSRRWCGPRRGRCRGRRWPPAGPSDWPSPPYRRCSPGTSRRRCWSPWCGRRHCAGRWGRPSSWTTRPGTPPASRPCRVRCGRRCVRPSWRRRSWCGGWRCWPSYGPVPPPRGGPRCPRAR
ncbi:ABC transporter permease [Streptomyces sp. NPDC013978]|uniref:ABC transporter permease n=1 Tax=Streptomyces sp. NPDC013978 TaxID=3364869 RepID=UPI0036FBD1A5